VYLGSDLRSSNHSSPTCSTVAELLQLSMFLLLSGIGCGALSFAICCLHGSLQMESCCSHFSVGKALGGGQQEGHGPSASPGSKGGRWQPGLCEQEQRYKLKGLIILFYSVLVRRYLDY